ncbi:GNAT family N-acetyltransferase [Undibacterium sp. TJN19]|uniref:GNAT family N-acetyltransferase n=1 Tax=Undibacterium sp. TJN19 TaxID=3413055 RepID=UPI003BF423ED
MANPDDLQQIIALRLRLFGDLVDFNHGKGVDAELQAATSAYFERSFTGDDCKTWLAEADGQIVAAGTLAIFSRPPYPGNVSGKDAYLLNMFTLPEYRGKGHGKAVLQQAMHYAQQHGYGKVWLHASDQGRPLYAAAGFVEDSSYMEWVIAES